MTAYTTYTVDHLITTGEPHWRKIILYVPVPSPLQKRTQVTTLEESERKFFLSVFQVIITFLLSSTVVCSLQGLPLMIESGNTKVFLKIYARGVSKRKLRVLEPPLLIFWWWMSGKPRMEIRKFWVNFEKKTGKRILSTPLGNTLDKLLYTIYINFLCDSY